MFVQYGAYPVCTRVGGTGICVHKEILAVGSVDETVADAVHLLEAEDAEGSPFGGYFVDDVRVGIREIILRIALLLHGNTQFLGICIVEKQNRTEYGTLAHALRADEVYIAVQVNVIGIGDVGTVDEDNSIQFSHEVPPFLRKG